MHGQQNVKKLEIVVETASLEMIRFLTLHHKCTLLSPQRNKDQNLLLNDFYFLFLKRNLK